MCTKNVRLCVCQRFWFCSCYLTVCPELAACLKSAKLIVNEKCIFEGFQLLPNRAQAGNGWNVFSLAKGTNSTDNDNNNAMRSSGYCGIRRRPF